MPPPIVSFTYNHRILRTRLPVRSAIFKQNTGGLVVRWVTTSEFPLLYVFAILSFLLVVRSGVGSCGSVCRYVGYDRGPWSFFLPTCSLVLSNEALLIVIFVGKARSLGFLEADWDGFEYGVLNY
jgi:hypothetical protein